MSLKLELAPYTLILTVGPSGCGKSTLAQQLLRALPAGELSVISSDALRRKLLGDDTLSKMDSRMTEASEAAFTLLEAQVKAELSVGTRYVLVDSTGLDKMFRDRMYEIAGSKGYHTDLILFDYKTKAEYSAGLEGAEAALAVKHADRLRKDVFPVLQSRKYRKVHTVKQRCPQRWSDLDVHQNEEDSRMLEAARQEVAISRPIAVIGDVHENVPALDLLVSRLPADALLVFVGDLIDKGGDTEGIVRYMNALVQSRDVLLVEGNHEHYIADALRKLEADPAFQLPDDHAEKFSSFAALKDDAGLRQDFMTLYSRMLPFVCIPGAEGRHTLYVTHAPCAERELGKPKFVKAMRNWRIDPDRPVLDQLEVFLAGAAGNKATHVFGHFAHKAPKLFVGNKVFLDTGYVHGGRLSALLLRNGSPEVVAVGADEVPPANIQKKDLPGTLRKAKDLVAVDQYHLSPLEQRVLRDIMKGGTKTISGTMAPCPSEMGEARGAVLESLDAGLAYFQKAGVDRVLLEPKYMGSRCQVYLYRNKPDECFAVSRSGFRIKHVPELPGLLAAWLERASAEDFPIKWDSELVLDGELLPWSAMGAKLIERDFLAYRACVNAELTALKNDPVAETLDFGRFAIDVSRHFEQLADFDKQLELYAKPAEPEFRAFTVLLVDGKPSDQNEATLWSAVNTDLAISVNPATDEGRAEAHAFFDKLTTAAGMEGVVLKPVQGKPGVLPYMKCRNERYLTLVYGYDYQMRYVEMCRTKRVGGKQALSLKEYALGQRMLLAKTDEEKEPIACALMFELRKEQTLDPRL